MTIVFEGRGQELAQQVKEWIEREQAAGARLFALEGLMGSGKTTVMRQIRALMPMIAPVELDSFHDPRGADRPRTWDDAYDKAEAVRHVRVMLEQQTVLIEGAVCWPTARECAAPTRYMYLKRMQFPNFWADQHELTEELHPNLVLRKSIRDHHATTKPWETADAVLERLFGADGE